MNGSQELWWQQARSDHEAFEVLRSQGIAQCHDLHYLQMVTEKLAKAYFWRSNSPPPKSHSGFVQFLRFLGQIRHTKDRKRIANLFSFHRFIDFQKWARQILPLAYSLERLAPDLARSGPNPEYPWPHDRPQTAPVNYRFELWQILNSHRGREFLRIIHIAIVKFPEYADI